MIKSFLTKFSLLFFISIYLLTSCEEDGTVRPIEPTPAGPSINLLTGPNQLVNDATIPAGSAFTVQVSAQAGEALLDVFTVKRNGINVPFSNLKFDKTDVGANPALIINSDYKTSINWTIQITSNSAGSGVDNYTFEIKDEENRSASTGLAITLESLPPSSQFVEEAPYFWEDKVCPLGSKFQVRIKAQKGTANLKTFAAYEDNQLISDLSRIKINAVNLLNNPTNISVDNQENLDFIVTISTSEEFFGTYFYEFVITDASGLETTQTINVTLGTPTTELSGKLLLNQAGPGETGGINLITGEGVASNSVKAQLKDQGINTDLVTANNWRQKIAGANGATIRLLSESVLEGFSFEGIFINEQIIDLFDTGTPLILTNANGVPVTDKIIGGEILLIEQEGVYFAVRIDNVVVTATDNKDYYELTIKN